MSVLAAATFWFFNSLNKSYEARLSYPVTFEFDRDSVVIVKPLPDEVRIDVSSGGWNLLRKTFWFSVEPLVIALDNPTEVKFLTRNSLFDIIKEQLSDLNLNRVVTDTLFISIEPKVEKKVKVVVDSLTIPLARGFRVVDSISYQPDSVVISGPYSLMSRFPDTWLLDFDRNDISGNFERTLDVPLTDKKIMSAYPKSVTVSFTAEEFVRDSVQVEVQSISFPATYRGKEIFLKDSLVYIFYTIRSSDAKKVVDSLFSVAADFKMYQRRDSSVTPMILYRPSEVFELEMVPESLKVGYDNQ